MTAIATLVREPEICATWARAGLADTHLVYEKADEWVFAGGIRSEIILTARDVRIIVRDGDGEPSVRTSSYSVRPAQALEEALASLDLDEWRAYGWVGFDFCAPFLGAAGYLADDDVLAHIFVPEFEAFLSRDGGIRFAGADEELRRRMLELAEEPITVDESARRPLSVTEDPTDYRGRVATAMGEIRSGRYEKVIMSREVTVPFDVDIPATYLTGRLANTPARSFMFRLGGLEAAGFSPELVGSVDADGVVTTEPLAGTRAFGVSPQADAAAREELENDAKEIVEHAISVRTSYAEVATVAVPGTTAVSEFMTVRPRGSVQHLASTVVGQLAQPHSAWDALEVLFPSVTASGIPKSPAIDAIYRLEATRRRVYSGAVVTVSSSGDLEAALVLRSVYRDGERSWLRAGAGVVGQSNPEREFTETCEKLGSVAPYLVADPGQAGR
ncbi:putative salicylate synthetase [Gordonia araii NBRC 100433]|uniref:Putative salicylate synthetase n=1 Tax=Gordonia araii NBRC 100433 TaxID=1073574 RepID=G7GX65_9ACTN|nr:salicylate synthase [Gordonia araii]NNG98179.1 salicylate synthase [Gordonia araii NBRC 100433]GAB08190.1 putative salicylate synthetase [Gordonia araii NBRC 100433]